MAEPKYLLIVTVSKGLVVRDTPRPESRGGKAIRSVSVGSQLYAYDVHYIENVPYARLVPLNPNKPEWVRAEADGNIKYVDVIELENNGNTLIDALNNIADAISELADKK